MENKNTVPFYEKYWQETSDSHDAGQNNYLSDPQLFDVISWILGRIETPSSIIDIGGGVSRFARMARGRGHTVTISDFSKWALGRMRREGFETIECDLRAYSGELLGGPYDIAVCTEVMEHLEDPTIPALFASAHAPAAYFSVPNNTLGPDECDTHIHLFDESKLRGALSEYFEVITVAKIHRWVIAECKRLQQ